MNFKKLFLRFFPSLTSFFLSVAIGASTTLFIYLAFLQRHFFSYRYLAYTILIAFAATLLTGWLINSIFMPRWHTLSVAMKRFILIVSVFLAFVLLINVKIEPIYYLLPDTTLEISLTIPPLPAKEEGVRMLWIETGQGYVPYTYPVYQGQWERIFGNTIFSPGQEVSLKWTGKVGKHAQLAFRQTAFNQPLKIIWDGVSREFNLQGNPQEDFFIDDAFHVSWYHFLPFIIAFSIFGFSTVLFGLAWISGWSLAPHHHKPKQAVHWLLFSLPMLLVWLLILLILWPGILSNDSLALWSMAQSGTIDDWQSAFYSILLAVMMRISPSPAFVLLIQIIAFSLVAAWGFSILQKNGVPKWVLWLLSILMAVFPPTLTFVVTLWKDIPYAIALFAFTIALLVIATTNGAWASKPLRWVSAGVIAFLVSIFRHNGGPVVLLVLVLLPVIYRKYWKYYVGSLLVTIFLYALVRGPLYNRMINQDSESSQLNLIYLHHIAAHVDAGTTLTQTEESYLNSLLPINEWDYNCCYVGNVSYESGFARAAFLTNTQENQRLAFNLFRRAPLVDVAHTFCAGEMAYQFMDDQQCWHVKSLSGFSSISPGSENWIGEWDLSNITEKPLLPALIQPLIQVLRPFGIFDSSLVFFLRPAFWLLAGFVSVSIASLRRDDLHLLLVISPILFQSLILFLIAFAPAFRYYYSSCVIGIFLLGCLFIPKKDTRTLSQQEN